MESRIRSIFLNTAVAATFLSLGATSVWAQDSEAAPEVINPAVERRDIDVAAIGKICALGQRRLQQSATQA